MDKTIDIGIDPPKGIAIYDVSKKKLIDLQTKNFWGLIEILNSYINLQDFKKITIRRVVIESPQKNKPVWSRGVIINQHLKIAQNVGENKATAKLIIEYCNAKGINVIESTPTRKSLTKLTRENFERITGWIGKSSEHSRDAAMLVFGG